MDPADQLKQEASCPVCLEYFQDPVMIDCGHNFCRRCLDRTWGGLGSGPCPQCRAVFCRSAPRPNRQLLSMVGLVRQLHLNQRTRTAPRHCPAHEERLTLFCEEDQQALCVLCTMTFDHLSHHLLPLEKARPKEQAHGPGLPAGSKPQEVSCEGCRDAVTDPVTPDCHHPFCRACVARSWVCPTCKPNAKATLWTPAVVTSQLGVLYDIMPAEPDPEPRGSDHVPCGCHEKPRAFQILEEDLFPCSVWAKPKDAWGSRQTLRKSKRAPRTPLQELKDKVRAERTKVQFEFRTLRRALREHKCLNLTRLEALSQRITGVERPRLGEPSLTSRFQFFRLSKDASFLGRRSMYGGLHQRHPMFFKEQMMERDGINVFTVDMMLDGHTPHPKTAAPEHKKSVNDAVATMETLSSSSESSSCFWGSEGSPIPRTFSEGRHTRSSTSSTPSTPSKSPTGRISSCFLTSRLEQKLTKA